MKTQLLPFTLLITTVAGLLLMAQPTLAQLSTYDSDPSLTTTGNGNPMPSGDLGSIDPLQVMQLLNNAAGTANPDQQDQQIDSAAAAYKAQQTQRFQQPQPTSRNIVPGNN
jgi:hypothetical protein